MKQKRTDNQTALPDETIIELYWSRNEQAIAETDKKYGNYLYTVAYNIVNDDLDSEECLNDTYLGTWNAIPPQRPNAFQVFLTKITRNIAINKFKRRGAAKRIPSEFIVSLDEIDESFPATPSIEEELASREIVRIMNEYLNGLSHEEQLLFVCRYYYADRVREIAEITGINERTVYRILESIRNGLRDQLKKEGYDV